MPFPRRAKRFRESLNWRQILDYWLAAKVHAWEVLWGAGVVGVPLALITLYYPPARWLVGFIVAWAFLVAGYYVWRADHIRLLPKFTVEEAKIQPTLGLMSAENK